MSSGPYAPPGAQPQGGETTQRLSHATEQVQEKAQDVAGQVQQQAQQAAGQAKSRLREQLDERSSQVAGRINEQASDLRAVSSSLREQGNGGPASAADKLAEYAERAGGYLSERDSDRLLADVEDFGRRQPWALAAGGLALGFAASRFLKASSRRRYSSRQGGQSSEARLHNGGANAAGDGRVRPPYGSETGYPGQSSYPSTSLYPEATAGEAAAAAPPVVPPPAAGF